MTPVPVPLLARLGAGSAVACDLVCPRSTCRAIYHGSAEVANTYGVRHLLPSRCLTCGVRLTVMCFVDLDAVAR